MIAKLHITTALRNGVTYLKECFFTPPFKVANITEDKKSNKLHLMLMSSSPGILDEDKYELKVELAANCVLELHTQSYQRLFNMKMGATQNMNVHLQPHSSFIYLPHPAVPHEDSIFTAINKIYLEEGCTLVWGEVLTCGRKLNGEVFKFSKYHNCTEIYFHNKLIIKENLLMQPTVINVHSIGQLEGFTHQASLIYLNETADIKRLNKAISEFVSLHEGIVFGISSLQKNGMVVRLLGQKGEQLFNLLQDISRKLTLLTADNAI